MRLLPGSRYYLCENCEVKFLSVLDLFSTHWPFGSVARKAEHYLVHSSFSTFLYLALLL